MKWTESLFLAVSACALLATAGCSTEGTDSLSGGGGGGGGNGNGDGQEPDGTDPSQPPIDPSTEAQANACSDKMTLYKGFGGTELGKERIKNTAGTDRGRIKPYSALGGEFQRVAGNTPKSLAENASTFTAAPARWYFEPQASAVQLYTAYRVAFDAALVYTSAAANAKYATAPTAASAGTECAAFEAKVWSREPSADEVAACTTVAVTDTGAEPDAKRRWAYAFASVLSSSGFITY